MERTKWMGKWLLSWVVFAVIFSIGGILFPLSPAVMAKISPADAKYSMLALAVVTLSLSFLVNYVISSSKVSGFKLFGAMLLLTWGIQTFMTQIETLVFIKAFPDLDTAGVLKIMAHQLFIFTLYIPFAMLLHGQWKTAVHKMEPQLPALKQRWYLWIPVIMAVYVILYLSFGLFPISFQETKDYYAAWIASNDSFGGGVRLALIQVVRSMLWFGCILPLFFILKGSKEKKMLMAGIILAVFPTFQLMFPNGLMPPIVRFGHFVEVFSEMLIFGALVGWMVIPEDGN